MPYYKAKYSILRKTPKYQIYISHFDNIPVDDVDFTINKDSDEIWTFYLISYDINKLNDAIEWIEQSIGLDPYETVWVEDSSKYGGED